MQKLYGALCDKCPLKDQPLVPAAGPYDAELIFVAEAPDAEEVLKGEPLTGSSGRLLQAALAQEGVDYQTVYRTNIVMCRPPGNRTPTEQEIYCCKPRLMHELDTLKGERVVTLGKTAHEALLSEWDLSERGMWLWQDLRYFLPTWHPAYVLRKPSEARAFLRDIHKAVVGPVSVPFKDKDPEVRHITDVKTLETILNGVPDNAWVAFDIETNQTQWYESKVKKRNYILMLQMSWELSFGIVIDDVMLYDEPQVITLLNEFFGRVRTVGHNGKFDQIFLSTIGVHINLDFDTMMAHYVLDEIPPHGLKELVEEEFDIPNYEDRIIKDYLRTRNDDYSKIPFDKLAQYGVLDTVSTLALRERYEERLRAQGLYEWPFQNIVMRSVNHFVLMEIKGIPVNDSYLKKAQELFQGELNRIIVQLREMSHRPNLNPNSTKEIAEILYDELRLPPPQSTKIGPRSTAHEALEPLEGIHPFVDTMLRYRRIAKLKSSFIDNFWEMSDANGCVHPSIKAHGTETGRLAMKDPAAQTIPRSAKQDAPDYDPFLDGAVVKCAVEAPEGYKWVIVDYSQAELRCLAHYSNDPFLINVYYEGRDLHSEVAQAMYGPSYTKEQRVRCKMFNFSWAYGGNEYSFARDQGLDINVARQFVRNYNKVMARAVRWKEEQYKTVLDKGYVETVFGRRRRFPFINGQNSDEVRKACVNAPIQSTASDLTLLSAIEVMDMGIDVRHLVHDSILALAPADQAEAVGEKIKDTMENMGRTYLPRVAWKADVEISKRWVEPPQLLGIEASYT